MASTDGSKRIDPAGGAIPATDGAGGDSGQTPQKARTAAEQRAQAAATSDDPQVLTAEIERTREELADTLDAIADKVSPKRVADRTKQQLGEKVAAAKETVSDKAATAKEVVVEKATTAKGAVSEKAATAKAAAGEKAGSVTARSDDSLADAGPAYASGSPALRPVRPVPAGTSPLVTPAVAGALAALVVALLVLRRRRH